jgi:hypothetical protein
LTIGASNFHATVDAEGEFVVVVIVISQTARIRVDRAPHKARRRKKKE